MSITKLAPFLLLCIGCASVSSNKGEMHISSEYPRRAPAEIVIDSLVDPSLGQIACASASASDFKPRMIVGYLSVKDESGIMRRERYAFSFRQGCDSGYVVLPYVGSKAMVGRWKKTNDLCEYFGEYDQKGYTASGDELVVRFHPYVRISCELLR